MPGYFPKMRQAAIVVSVELNTKAFDQQILNVAHAEFLRLIPAYQEKFDKLSVLHDYPLRQLFSACMGVLVMAGFPVIDEMVIDERTSPSSSIKSLIMPALSMSYSANHLALNWLMTRMNFLHNHFNPEKYEEDVRQAALEDSLRKLIQQMAVYAPTGQNSLRFIQAAQQLDIPYVRINANVFQFGWGRYARWLDSSFTDETPNISTRIARNKVATSRFLRNVGIPVCQQFIVKNADEAAEHAAKMQFPVVIKPSDQDGGRGVHVGLKNVAEVRYAFAEASKLSNTILLEQQFIGRDYRIQVYQGQVYWAVHRIPGGVTGDGQHSVQELLDIQNAQPARGEPGSNALLKRIYINQEAESLLDEQGLELNSIPAVGQYVRLRQAANVASGGSIVPVLDIAHPDNLRLAERAARMLRLDLAGIDLLIPDIRQSWLETGAAICEVNAQPQMSPHLPLEILGKLVHQKGLIPIIVVLGEIDDVNWSQDLQEHLNKLFPEQTLKIGTLDAHACRIAGVSIMATPIDPYIGSLALLSDPDVAAVVLNFSGGQFLNSGLAVDRIANLVLYKDRQHKNNADLKEWMFCAQFLMKMRVEKLSIPSHLQQLTGAIKLPDDTIKDYFEGGLVSHLSQELQRQFQRSIG
ncbi:acetate--CoA ligase family protein [Undibacterium flavidum]|uniref:ATP-grasp domain-containing protein n=1 Tax=Undibacterium flavidum TaxID=2762297 RepID=A0ABR6YBE9_9BURK|nr:acetate--CoA ligase family protein [Undibacterium flavidum]MBC3873870.1 hypothetical protein [Undibacterium flavidum]